MSSRDAAPLGEFLYSRLFAATLQRKLIDSLRDLKSVDPTVEKMLCTDWD